VWGLLMLAVMREKNKSRKQECFDDVRYVSEGPNGFILGSPRDASLGYRSDSSLSSWDVNLSPSLKSNVIGWCVMPR
jgi:hypothetical protein